VPFRQLVWFEAVAFQRAGAVVVDHDIGAGQQGGCSFLPGGVPEVDVGAAGAGVGLGVDEFVFVVVRTGRTQHVRPVLGQGPAHDWARDGVGERQDADAVERPLRRAEVPCRGVADALQADDRLARQEGTLRMSQPFSGRAYDARRKASGVRGLFQLGRVPPLDGCGDLGGAGWHVQEAAPLRGQMRVHA
jgi:hypothetical protein